MYTKTRHDEDGATAVEYALMVALIGLVIVAAVTAMGLSVKDLFPDADLLKKMFPTN